VFFTYKEYNSDNIAIRAFNFSTFSNIDNLERRLNSNETIPVLSYDHTSDIIYVATTDSDRIYQMRAKDLTDISYAVLPVPLRKVSSSLAVNGFLYVVTWEPMAKVGRFDLSKAFCRTYCGQFGFCSGGQCFCAPGYVPDTTRQNINPIPCIPRYEVEIIRTASVEKSLSITLGILFGLSTAGAIVGWFMWWRRRKSDSSFTF